MTNAGKKLRKKLNRRFAAKQNVLAKRAASSSISNPSTGVSDKGAKKKAESSLSFRYAAAGAVQLAFLLMVRFPSLTMPPFLF